MNQTVTLEVFYPHSPERVWQALTDRRALAVWMMDNDFEPRLGHKFHFRQGTLPGLETSIDCEVIELEPPKRLAYRWQDCQTECPTIVTWTLTATAGGTTLQLQHHQEVHTTAVSASVLHQSFRDLYNPVPRSKAYKSLMDTLTLQASSGSSRSLQFNTSSTWITEYSLISQAEWNDRLTRLTQELNSDYASDFARKSLETGV
jgi:uncharacterized protein YndB with AHSA1/START domain